MKKCHSRFAQLRYLFMLATLMAGLLSLPYAATALDMERLQNSMVRRFGGNAQNFFDWQKLMHDNKDMSTPEKLRRVNEFFNRRIRFGDDQEIWGKSDYWATPMETLAKGAGDCEDFTIAKYFTLRVLNIPTEQLRLIYVKAFIGGPASSIQQVHMVLAYYPSLTAEPLVLDNLITDIRPASRRSDLQPVFSFNSQGVFSGAEAGAVMGKGGVNQLSPWRELLQRARDEGFD